MQIPVIVEGQLLLHVNSVVQGTTEELAGLTYVRVSGSYISLLTLTLLQNWEGDEDNEEYLTTLANVYDTTYI